jgi:hypothetical protein
MKWIYAVATIALLASSALAYEYETPDAEDGEARLGYINVGTNGVTSLTFNATSIQNAVILLLFLGLIGALIAPLFLGAAGAGAEATADAGYGYGYGQEQAYADSQGYAGYAKRSLIDTLGSGVAAALSNGYKKYDDDEPAVAPVY